MAVGTDFVGDVTVTETNGAGSVGTIDSGDVLTIKFQGTYPYTDETNRGENMGDLTPSQVTRNEIQTWDMSTIATTIVTPGAQ